MNSEWYLFFSQLFAHVSSTHDNSAPWRVAVTIVRKAPVSYFRFYPVSEWLQEGEKFVRSVVTWGKIPKPASSFIGARSSPSESEKTIYYSLKKSRREDSNIDFSYSHKHCWKVSDFCLRLHLSCTCWGIAFEALLLK